MQIPEHILLIDDNEEDNEFHELIMRETKLAGKITCFTDSVKAFSFFEDIVKSKAEFPELIFLDTLMPKIDGFELLTMLKDLINSNPEIRQKPKIFMLGGAYNYQVEAYLKNPEFNHLLMGYKVKPLTKASFTGIVEQYF